MTNIFLLIWMIFIAITVFALMFFALQSLDFSKLFRANSTTQIKIFIFFISLVVGLGVATGIIKLLELITNCF